MSKTIWKFSLDITDRQNIQMPVGARIRHVGKQFGSPCLWAEVDTEARVANRVIGMFGTGHDLPDNPGEFIGTIMFEAENSALVLHVYDGGIVQ